jgi:hypothetical protein
VLLLAALAFLAIPPILARLKRARAVTAPAVA